MSVLTSLRVKKIALLTLVLSISACSSISQKGFGGTVL